MGIAAQRLRTPDHKEAKARAGQRHVHTPSIRQETDAAEVVARKALQTHGAIGYTTEHGLHFWLKRSWALASSWGDALWHRRRVAHLLLDN
jgi:alkylation response protein AidB-like acyl-CoA dehydrogenase